MILNKFLVRPAISWGNVAFGGVCPLDFHDYIHSSHPAIITPPLLPPFRSHTSWSAEMARTASYRSLEAFQKLASLLRKTHLMMMMKITSLKFNIDTKKKHVWKEIHSFQTIIFGIYIKFWGCTTIIPCREFIIDDIIYKTINQIFHPPERCLFCNCWKFISTLSDITTLPKTNSSLWK